MILTKNQIKSLLWKLITLLVIVITVISIKFEFSILNITLLTLATPVLFWLSLFVVKPFITKLLKIQSKQEKELERHIKIALKQGKKPYKIGKLKHVIYATNNIQAHKIFTKIILPELKKQPGKRFDYISKSQNNI